MQSVRFVQFARNCRCINPSHTKDYQRFASRHGLPVDHLKEITMFQDGRVLSLDTDLLESYWI